MPVLCACICSFPAFPAGTLARKAYMETWELYQEAAALPLTSKQQEMVQEKLAEIQRAVE